MTIPTTNYIDTLAMIWGLHFFRWISIKESKTAISDTNAVIESTDGTDSNRLVMWSFMFLVGDWIARLLHKYKPSPVASLGFGLGRATMIESIFCSCTLFLSGWASIKVDDYLNQISNALTLKSQPRQERHSVLSHHHEIILLTPLVLMALAYITQSTFVWRVVTGFGSRHGITKISWLTLT